MLQQECTRASCPEMKAGEWLYLCVAHGNDGAMEVCRHFFFDIYLCSSSCVAMLRYRLHTAHTRQCNCPAELASSFPVTVGFLLSYNISQSSQYADYKYLNLLIDISHLLLAALGGSLPMLTFTIAKHSSRPKSNLRSTRAFLL